MKAILVGFEPYHRTEIDIELSGKAKQELDALKKELMIEW